MMMYSPQTILRSAVSSLSDDFPRWGAVPSNAERSQLPEVKPLHSRSQAEDESIVLAKAIDSSFTPMNIELSA
jgi:hypothetical protein